MRLSVKIEKYESMKADTSRHMFEVTVNNGDSKFETFEIVPANGLHQLLEDINAAKQALEDYLCEHE